MDGEDDGDDIDMHTRKLEEVLEVYEQRLGDSEFLAGNKFTLADLVHLPNSHYITASDKFLYLYDSRKNVRRWWYAISTRDSWQQVLRDMKRVEDQHKQEELKQQQQKEHLTTSSYPIQIDSQKQISAEPRTILVPPADTFSSPPVVHDAIDDKFANQLIIDERIGEPMQMQPPSQDAHPGSAHTKRATPNGHGVGDLEFVSTPEGQISEDTKARHDPATVHKDVRDANLLAHDVAKDTFKETKVVDSTPSSAKPVYTQQPALSSSRHAEADDAKGKGRKSSQTFPERQKVVETKTGTSGGQSSDLLKAIPPSRQAAAEDARDATDDSIQSPDILDTTTKSRDTFEEAKDPDFTLVKAESLGAQDAQHTNGESTTPTADVRKDVSTNPQSDVQDGFQQSKLPAIDWNGLGSLPSEGKDAEATVTEQKSFSTERLKDMLKESESATPTEQPIDSQGSIEKDNTSSVHQKKPLVSPASWEQAQAIPAREEADGSTPKHQQASDAPHTFDEKLRATGPIREKTHDDHSAEDPYRDGTANDQKVAPPLLSKEPTSQVRPPSEPSQDVAFGDLSGKLSIIDKWQRASAPLNDGSIDSVDTEMAMSSNMDKKPIPMSQEAPLSSQNVNQMAKQSDDQRMEPAVPIGTQTSDVRHAVPSLPEAATDDKFAKQSIVDERVREPKQMQAPITDAHPALAPTKRGTPDGHETGDLELARASEDQGSKAVKATEDPATVHEYAHYAPIDEKTATYHASGDQLVTGSLHDQQTRPPASTQEATTPIADPTSTEPQLGGTLPAEVAHAEQKSTPSDQESAHAAQPLSPVEPVKIDSNVSTDYTNAPQVFQQQARPSALIARGVPASDTQGVIRKIQEVIPDNRRTDDSGKPLVPSQEQVPHASQAIPSREDMTSPPGARDSPTSDTQLASGEVHKITPDDHHADESMMPFVSSGKQGSHVESAFGPGAVGPAEKKFAPSDLAHSAEQPSSGEPRKEQTVVPTSEQIKEQPTVIHQQDTSDTIEALTSEDERDNIPTHGDVRPTSSIDPARRPLSIQGEESTSATEAQQPRVAHDSLHTGDIPADSFGNAQSVQPSTTPDAHRITPVNTPGEVALADQKSTPSGQDSADPAQPPFSRGPRSKEIRDSVPSPQLIPSPGPRKGIAIVAAPDQAKDSQTTPGQQDILSTQRPSGEVQEDVPDDDSGKAKPSKLPSAVQEGNPPTVVPASAPDIQLGSAPNDEQKFAPSGQGSAFPTQPPSSADPMSKAIRDIAPLTELSSTTELRGDAIVAAADQGKDSQTAPGRQDKLSAPLRSVFPSSYTQRPSGKVQEDEPADDSGEAKSSKLPSVVQESKPAAPLPVSAPDTQLAVDEHKFAPSGQGSADTAYPASAPETQHGTVLDQVTVDEQKFAPSGQDSAHSVQPSFSTEPTKEDTVVAATDQTNTLQKIIHQKDTTHAPDKAKTPFSGTHDASSKIQRGTDDDRIDESLPRQGQVSLDGHASEPHEGHTTDSYRTNVDKQTATPLSSQLISSEARPDSTPTHHDVRSSIGDDSTAVSQDVSFDASGKAKSTDPEAMAPTGDLPSVPDTPAERKISATEEEPAHVSEPPSSAEPRKEETNVAAADQPDVPQTIISHQVTALAPDAREALLKDQEPFRGDDHTRNLENPLTVSQEQASHAGRASESRGGPTPEVHSDALDWKKALLSSQAQGSNTGPDSTPIDGDAHLTSGDVPATSSLPATQVPTIQDLQGSAPAQNVPTDSLGKIESPRQLSTDRAMAPIMSPSAPSVAPLGTAPGTNSVQPTRLASMAPIVDTQRGIPQGEAASAEHKFAASDQESAHSSEPPASAEPRKEEANAAAADQPNVPQGPQTTIGHQGKAPEPHAREALWKDQQPARDDGHISNLADTVIASQEQTSPAGHASELREGQTPEIHRSAIEKKTALPSSQAQTSDTGPDSTPISGDANLSSRDVPATSYLQNQEAQPPVKTQEPTIQALQGSASAKNISLGKIDSPRQPSTEQVMGPVTRSAPSDVPQGTESGTDSVQPPQEASFDLSSDEKTTTTQDDQVNTLPDGDLSTSQAVGQSESTVSKGINFQKNLEGASTDENSKAQQQIDQSDAESPKYKNNEVNGAVRSNISTTFGELQKQPSCPKESSEEPERQQQADQDTVQSLEGNKKQIEQTRAHDTGTDEPEARDPSENANEKNNKISEVEALDHSGKQASGVTLQGENTKDASNSPEDAPGDIQALNKSEDSLRSSEESKVQLQLEGKTQGRETEAPSPEIEQPRERGLPDNSDQDNSGQSQAEASDKSIEHSDQDNSRQSQAEASDKSIEQSPGIQNKNQNSSRLDGPTNATNSGDMEDDSQ